MARRGRKRSIQPRNTKGRIIHQPQEDPRIVAMNQPHRLYDPEGKRFEKNERGENVAGARGCALEWLAEPVGRLCAYSGYLSGFSRTACYEASQRFLGAWSSWDAINGRQRPLANSTAGSDRNLDKDQIERITMNYLEASQSLGGYGYSVRYVLYEVLPDDWYPAPKMEFECVQGLFLLSDHYGLDYRGEDRRVA